MKNTKYALCVFGCYGLWGILPVFYKVFNDLPAMYALAVRTIWSLPVCIVIVLFLRRTGDVKKVLKNKRTLLLVTLAGVIMCLSNLVYVLALSLNRIVEMSLGYFIQPLITVVLGIIFFKERLNKMEGTAIALATIGVCMMIFRMGSLPWIALLAAIILPVYCVVKRFAGVDSEVSATVENLMVFPFFLIYALFIDFGGGGSASVFSGVQLLYVPLAGLFNVLPVFMLGIGVNNISLALVGVLGYISPTLQLLLGVLLYKEAFSAGHLLAFAFIWAAIILFSVSSFRKSKLEAGLDNS